jgi:hypothetical protein
MEPVGLVQNSVPIIVKFPEGSSSIAGRDFFLNNKFEVKLIQI